MNSNNEKRSVQILPSDTKAYGTSVAAKAVGYFDRIYHEESLLNDISSEERYEQRLAKIKPLLDELFAWLETVQVSGKGKLAEAVRYALNERKYMYTFLDGYKETYMDAKRNGKIKTMI